MDVCGYLTSGECIVAALLAGLPILALKPPEAWFGISKGWVSHQFKRQNKKLDPVVYDPRNYLRPHGRGINDRTVRAIPFTPVGK